MEVGEVTRSQQIATEAEQMLEEATNKVRMLSSDLQAAQENAATCAMRAHTAQLQLAAHDQLMFTARQKVDALSAQMVSVQVCGTKFLCLSHILYQSIHWHLKTIFLLG